MDFTDKIKKVVIACIYATGCLGLYIVCEAIAVALLPYEWRAAFSLAMLLAALFALWCLLVQKPTSGVEGGSTNDIKNSFGDFIGCRAFSPLSLPFLILLGISLNLVFSRILALLPLPDALVSSYGEASSHLGNSSPVWLLSTVIFTPLLEEIVFRGLVLSRLSRGIPTWAAFILSSLIFGLFHSHPIWIVYATLSGLVLGAVRLSSGSVYASALAHAAFNGANFILVYLPVSPSRPTQSSISWIAVGIFGVVISGLALYHIARRAKKSRAR